MDEYAITGRLEQIGDDEEFITPNRIQLLRQLSRIYNEQGLLNARSAPALHNACKASKACWRNLPRDARPSGGTQWGFSRDAAGSVLWPWVGDQYKPAGQDEPGGVLYVSLNFRSSDEDVGVGLEYVAAQNARKVLKAGHKKDPEFKSTFAYGWLATAAAVISSQERGRLMREPKAEWLYKTGVMERVARVQLVKCTPIDKSRKRGEPSEAMCERCPSIFLWKELEVLLPGVVVAFGWDAYRELERYEGVDSRPSVKVALRRRLLSRHSRIRRWPRG